MKPLFTAEDVLQRIHHLTLSIIECLDRDQDPILSLNEDDGSGGKSMDNLSQCRGYTNIILILSFVQKLLLSQRSTTNREVYYFFVTHFRSQRECDSAIIEVCNLLGVERISLGLSASPKGTTKDLIAPHTNCMHEGHFLIMLYISTPIEQDGFVVT